MLDLSPFRSAVFDFDGVVLDSNGAKTEAFRTTLAEDPPDLVDRFVAYHQAQGGVSRFEKFRHYYRDMCGLKNFEEAADAAVQRFGAHSREALLAAAEVPGVVQTLTALADTNKPAYVVSGGAEHEVRDIVTARGYDRYFTSVHGSPATKTDNLSVLENSGALRRPAVYFGDARLDMEAALAFDLTFVFVSGYSEWEDGLDTCRDRGLTVIRDFHDVR